MNLLFRNILERFLQPVHFLIADGIVVNAEVGYLCLFKILVNVKKVLLLPQNTTIWDVVDSCFVDKDGNHFGKDRLRKQQKPAVKRLKMLEDVATFLP